MMFTNFDEVKNQLKELSDVINSFKSEAVQLRIIDLIFGTKTTEEEPTKNKPEATQEKPKPRKRKAKPKTNDNGTTKKSTKTTVGQGPVATVTKLAESGFFDTPKAIKDITEHCEVNLARKIKPSDISGKLIRMVRDGELEREKNEDGQYEYKKP